MSHGESGALASEWLRPPVVPADLARTDPMPSVTDELWDRIRPLLPARPRRSRDPGRKPLDDRQVLNGILLVLVTGIAWEHLPRELGCGSGMTCWRPVAGLEHGRGL